MTFDELKKKAHSLPAEPGVYLMHDRDNTVIYVGKAKKLCNRVSSYFADLASHTAKTRKMVSQIDRFDVIIAASEFEALVLECSLIKRHMPKYNILLKDDKGYPYLRIDNNQPYPVMELVSRVKDDGALYFGPYGGRFITQSVMDTLRLCLRLPGCGKKFPRDCGKDRPCLNYHMKNCDAWCQSAIMQQAYRQRMEQAIAILQGNYQKVVEELSAQIEAASAKLDFENAAVLRDRMRAVESLGNKQLVTAGTMANTDVVGFYQSEAKACFSVLHYVDGDLLDKDYEILSPPDDREEALNALVKQYYLGKRAVPKQIFLPFAMEDSELFEQLLFKEFQKKVHIRVPRRGDGVRLLELAEKNAREEAERVTSKEERIVGSLKLLSEMLGFSYPLHRLESYDVSHTAGTDIVSSMVVYIDGRPSKKDYKHFKIEGLSDQDDYASMQQTVKRRFSHYLHQDSGFSELPDVLLIDGGREHAKCVDSVLAELNLFVPVFGMVKDSRHRTKALLTSDGREISISSEPAVFSLVGQIQEQTHHFAISYHRKLRSKRMRESELEKIPGIGVKRRQLLMKHYRSVSAISKASVEELKKILPPSAAEAVWYYFHPKEEE